MAKSYFRPAIFAFALSAFAGFGVQAEEAKLNIYNWNDYIAPDTIPTSRS